MRKGVKSLPSAFSKGTWQRGQPSRLRPRCSGKATFLISLPGALLCRVVFYFFVERFTLPCGFVFFCRALFFAKCFCASLPSVILYRAYICMTLGKGWLCRAPALKLSAKTETLGKVSFSRSATAASSNYYYLQLEMIDFVRYF